MKSSKQKNIEIIAQELERISNNKIVLDIGTPKRFSKDMSYFRGQLVNYRYYAIGYSPKAIYGDDNCDINGNIHSLPFKKNSIDVVFCLEVIEHISNPFLAINELHRVLKRGGTIFLTAPFLLPYHGKSTDMHDSSHENYPDFWRFTHQGLLMLFNKWSDKRVFPYTNTVEYYIDRFFKLVGFPLYKSKLFQQVISAVQKPKAGCTTHRHLIVGVK